MNKQSAALFLFTTINKDEQIR